jgi:hypothetical protein
MMFPPAFDAALGARRGRTAQDKEFHRMTRSLTFAFVLIVLIALGGFLAMDGLTSRELAQAEGAGQTAAAEAPAKEGYKLVAPLEVVMEVCDDLFYGLTEKRLKDKKFKELKRETLFLAEVANVISYAHAEAKADDTAAWKRFSLATRDALLKLAKAAESKDEKEFTSLHKKVEETCESCHDKFR